MSASPQSGAGSTDSTGPLTDDELECFETFLASLEQTEKNTESDTSHQAKREPVSLAEYHQFLAEHERRGREPPSRSSGGLSNEVSQTSRLLSPSASSQANAPTPDEFGLLSTQTDPLGVNTRVTYSGFASASEQALVPGIFSKTTTRTDGQPEKSVFFNYDGEVVRTETGALDGRRIIVDRHVDALGRVVRTSRPSAGYPAT